MLKRVLAVVRRLLGSEGRRKIYERVGRVESRVVELQIQLARLSAFEDAANKRHAEAMAKLVNNDTFTAGLLHSLEDRRIKVGALYDALETLRAEVGGAADAARSRHADLVSDLLNADRIRALLAADLLQLSEQIKSDFLSVEEAAKSRHAHTMANLLSTDVFARAMTNFNADRQSEGQVLERALASLRSDAVKQFHEIFQRIVVLSRVPEDVRMHFSSVEDAAKTRHADLISNLLGKEQFERSFETILDRLSSQKSIEEGDRASATALFAEIMRRLAEISREAGAEGERLRDLDVMDAQQTGPSRWPRAFELSTDHPLAIHSDDHRFPRGTANDNTRSPRFVAACQRLFQRPINHLDLGCAGGGLVRDFLIGGHRSMGLEGSDWSLLEQRAEWRALGARLQTCDITQPFRITDQGASATFDMITAWEVLEHLPADTLPQFLANVRLHLATDGLFVASIATFEDKDPETGAVWHVTLEGRAWWTEQFERAGLTVVETPFAPRDYVRGSGRSVDDWDGAAQPHMGFHLVAKRLEDLLLYPEKSRTPPH